MRDAAKAELLVVRIGDDTPRSAAASPFFSLWRARAPQPRAVTSGCGPPRRPPHRSELRRRSSYNGGAGLQRAEVESVQQLRGLAEEIHGEEKNMEKKGESREMNEWRRLSGQRDKAVVEGPTCIAVSRAEKRLSVQRPGGSREALCHLAAPLNRTKSSNYISGCRKIP
jgi:hypothetical protein